MTEAPPLNAIERVWKFIEDRYGPGELFRPKEVAAQMDWYAPDGTWPTVAMSMWLLVRDGRLLKFYDVAAREENRPYALYAINHIAQRDPEVYAHGWPG